MIAVIVNYVKRSEVRGTWLESSSTARPQAVGYGAYLDQMEDVQ
jgi:hypothetical protein